MKKLSLLALSAAALLASGCQSTMIADLKGDALDKVSSETGVDSSIVNAASTGNIDTMKAKAESTAKSQVASETGVDASVIDSASTGNTDSMKSKAKSEAKDESGFLGGFF